MNGDYIFINKNHRQQNKLSSDYLTFSEYLVVMYDAHGLMHDALAPFKIPYSHTCFKVIDKGKAFLFCLNNGEFLVKPEQSNKNFGNHNPTGI